MQFPLLKLFLQVLAKIVQPDFQSGFYKNVQVLQVTLPLTPVEKFPPQERNMCTEICQKRFLCES